MNTTNITRAMVTGAPGAVVLVFAVSANLAMAGSSEHNDQMTL